MDIPIPMEDKAHEEFWDKRKRVKEHYQARIKEIKKSKKIMKSNEYWWEKFYVIFEKPREFRLIPEKYFRPRPEFMLHEMESEE